MSLKGLTMRSQRQAAYGLIPDSLLFLGLLSISQLPLLKPTLPAGGMIPIFESNLIFRLQALGLPFSQQGMILLLRTSRIIASQPITLSDEDIDASRHPHLDAVYITAYVGDSRIRRTMVYNGEGINVCTLEIAEALGISEEDFTPCITTQPSRVMTGPPKNH